MSTADQYCRKRIEHAVRKLRNYMQWPTGPIVFLFCIARREDQPMGDLDWADLGDLGSVLVRVDVPAHLL